MRNRNALFVGLLSALAVVALGCAEPPQQEVDAARAALSNAEGSEAATYAADQWRDAQAKMDAVQAELEAQEAKFALFRSYDKAKELVAEATTAAEAASEAAAAGKEQARQAAQSALAAAQESLAGASGLIATLEGCRRRPKGFAADLATMKANLEALEGQVAGIESAIAAEDFSGAQALAEALKGQADQLASDLDAAKTKIGC